MSTIPTPPEGVTPDQWIRAVALAAAAGQIDSNGSRSTSPDFNADQVATTLRNAGKYASYIKGNQ